MLPLTSTVLQTREPKHYERKKKLARSRGWRAARWETVQERKCRVSPFDLALHECHTAAGFQPFIIPCMEYAVYARGPIALDTGAKRTPFRITRYQMKSDPRRR